MDGGEGDGGWGVSKKNGGGRRGSGRRSRRNMRMEAHAERHGTACLGELAVVQLKLGTCIHVPLSLQNPIRRLKRQI